MATSDLTRDVFDPRKRYRSVRLQQGRVLSDDDFNEAERIRLEEERRARLEIVGPYGSSDDGFGVSEPGFVDDGVDFRIGAGSLWVGGLRFERGEEESYREQADWLTHPLGDSDGGGVRAPQGERSDLVYVECWLQPVSAVEDGELFEAALGGPNPSTRLRSMCRVKLHQDVETGDCDTAWNELVDDWADAGRGRVNPEHELVVNTRLRVECEPEDEAEDLCTPSVEAGYPGAENQAIRVELLGEDRIIWGFDNGGPLHRVRVIDGEDDRSLELLTEPKDDAQRPRQGQVVEVIPWGAVLVNGEKVADDLEPGFLAYVQSYDVVAETGRRRLTLNRSLSEDGFLERAMRWTERRDGKDLRKARFRGEGPSGGIEEELHLYLRIWDQGSVPEKGRDRALGEVPGLDLDPDRSASLRGTGLVVRLSGSNGAPPDQRPGDYWIISARPEAPEQVVPWELQRSPDDGGGSIEGRAPHGVRRFCAPLAVIEWNAGDEPTNHVVHDCRPTFRPLTESEGAGRFTPEGRMRRRGHVDDLQRAVSSLSNVLMQREKGFRETEHAGVRSEAIERALEHTKRLRDALEDLRALDEIERPKLSDRGALVEGRCVNANGQGVAGYSVFLVDAQGNRLRELGEVATGATGYFGLVAKEEKLDRLAETRAVHGVSLVVESADGDTIYDHPESLELEPGARINLGNLQVSE